MEIWKSRLSAEAIPGVDATVAPIPRPTASMPSRAKPRALTICSFLSTALADTVWPVTRT